MIDRWLDARMQERNMTDAQVGEAVGVNETTVSRWRRGKKLPDRQFIIPLAKLFRTSPLTILQMTDPSEVEDDTREARGMVATPAG